MRHAGSDLISLRLYLECSLRTEETDIELHEEVCLPEDHRRFVGLCPCEDQADGATKCELRMHRPYHQPRASTAPRLPLSEMIVVCASHSAPSATPAE